jgi:dihydrofolate reductase
MTRHVILYIAMSLDGCIAKNDGDISFLSVVERAGEDYGYNKFLKSVDTVIMGRKTYDKVLSYGIDFPHRDRKCYVLSRHRTGSDENVEFYSGEIKQLITSLRQSNGKNIFIDGGAETVSQLMKYNLIDQYIISVIPYLLGSGIPLFKPGIPGQKLKLIHHITFPSGLVQLWYERTAEMASI